MEKLLENVSEYYAIELEQNIKLKLTVEERNWILFAQDEVNHQKELIIIFLFNAKILLKFVKV